MNSTRRAIRHRAITLKQRFQDIARFKRPVLFGSQGNIITNDLEGSYNFPQNGLLIDGCDWKGAAHIYFCVDPYNQSIADRDCFYFMLPGEKGEAILNKQAIFIIFFHHLYSKLQFPFRTAIEDKFRILKSHLETESYEKELMEIQKAIGLTVFRDWKAFMSMFDIGQKADNLDSCDDERVKELGKFIPNANKLLVFLKLPIDAIDELVIDMDFFDGITRDDLLSLVLEKLDSHEIYLTTGVMPIVVDWMRRLDMILKRNI